MKCTSVQKVSLKKLMGGCSKIVPLPMDFSEGCLDVVLMQHS